MKMPTNRQMFRGRKKKIVLKLQRDCDQCDGGMGRPSIGPRNKITRATFDMAPAAYYDCSAATAVGKWSASKGSPALLSLLWATQ